MFNISHHLENILNNGYTIVRNAIDNDLIDRVIEDFNVWSSDPENNFLKNSKARLINFHSYSKNTLDIVTNKYVHDIVSSFLGQEQVVYSSLFFREGTSQHYHRDTPHFFTNPIDKYCGVWYALEDIDVKAGPLKYFIGSHKLNVPDGFDVFNKLYGDDNKFPDMSYSQKNYNALLEYNKYMEDKCRELNLIEMNEKNYEKINKGDVIIWHPKLLHGGSDIIDESLTRYSFVTHNVPINTQVFNASHFFRKSPSEEYLQNKFNFTYINHNGVKLVYHPCKPQVQRSYI